MYIRMFNEKNFLLHTIFAQNENTSEVAVTQSHLFDYNLFNFILCTMTLQQ